LKSLSDNLASAVPQLLQLRQQSKADTESDTQSLWAIAKWLNSLAFSSCVGFGLLVAAQAPNPKAMFKVMFTAMLKPIESNRELIRN
jgi:hypothetical protein